MNRTTKILASAVILAIVGVLGYAVYTRGPQKAVPRIFIVQAKPQEWADALKLGFSDGLEAEGLHLGKDFVLISKSAAGDPQGLTNLAEAVGKQECAAVYTLGTQASQEVFRAVGDKPMIFGAVTDPVEAGFYDGNLSKPKGNVTGTQDLWPYQAQFDLILKLVPKAKVIGTVYNSSEINSQVSLEYVKKECKKRDLTLVEKTVTEEAQIALAVSGLLDRKIDVMYIPADNTAQTSSQVIIAACMQKKIPVFTGIPGIVENGALGTVGTNYYELGKVNAKQAARILRGEAARNIPVSIADNGDLYLNAKAAKQLSIEIPAELRKHAVKVYE